ncbi:hypothetical protein SDC9_147070 [bioreactor metagenome]|uniref:Uncharacterized protein n=1 Tax=bioreactor metagenome TaxID=1076179 RepID=A0A645EEM4_9ZZZZ
MTRTMYQKLLIDLKAEIQYLLILQEEVIETKFI